MAFTITPSRPVPGVSLYTYTTLSTADTPTAIPIGGTSTLAGFIQVFGTFGAATVKLQGSNDGTNWVDLNDIVGTTIGLAAAGGRDFTTSATYVRPSVTGGTADSISVLISFRG